MPKLKKDPPQIVPLSAATPKLTYSIPEAEEATSLCKSTLYNLMEDGRLAFVKVGRRRLIPASSLEALVALPPVA